MKKLFLLVIMVLTAVSTTVSLEPMKVAFMYTTGGPIDVHVQLADNTDNALFIGEIFTDVNPNSSGIVIINIEDHAGSGGVWAGINADDVTTSHTIDIYVGSSLYAQYRLDALLLNQAQTSVFDNSGNFNSPSANSTLGTDGNRWKEIFVDANTLHIGPDGGMTGSTEMTLSYNSGEGQIGINGVNSIIASATGVTIPGTLTLSNLAGSGTLNLKVDNDGNIVSDDTPEVWVNNNANTRVELGTLSDGVTARPSGTEMVVQDDGKVGIGTTTPGDGISTKLDVVGGVSFRTNTSDENKVLIFDNNGNAHRIFTDATSGTASDLVFGTYPNGHTDQLYLQQSTGNVGIGTSTPGANLDVDGSFKVSSDVTLSNLSGVGTRNIGVDATGKIVESAGGGGGNTDVTELYVGSDITISTTTYVDITTPTNLDANSTYMIKGVLSMNRDGGDSVIDILQDISGAEINYFKLNSQFTQSGYYETFDVQFNNGAYIYDGMIHTDASGSFTLKIRKNNPGNDDTIVKNTTKLLLIKIK